MGKLIVFALLLFPFVGFAETVPVGFPTSALWLSKSAPSFGEAVTLYTVVHNGGSAALTGDVRFMNGTTTIAVVPFSAPPGSSKLLEATWTASAGNHAFVARIEGTDAVSSTATATTSVVVAAPPPPSEESGSSSKKEENETVARVKGAFDSATPFVSQIASSTVAKAEDIRASAIVALSKVASSTTVSPTSTTTPEENLAKSFDIGATIQNIWAAILNALLYIFRSPVLFYVFVAFVLFVLLSFAKTMLSERRD